MDEEGCFVAIGWGMVCVGFLTGTIAAVAGAFLAAIFLYLLVAGGLLWLVCCFVHYRVPTLREDINDLKETVITWTR